jgi:uncharacterized membrane protein
MKNKMSQSVVMLMSLMFSVGVVAAPIASEISYQKDVSPIVHDYCLNCHQPGGKGYEASGLDMRTYQSLMKGTKFGSVINAGNSFTSIMIQVIEGRAHASIKMPFGMNGGLAKDNIEILKKWVNQGAKNN